MKITTPGLILDPKSLINEDDHSGPGLVCTTSEAIQEFLDEHEGYQVQEFLEKTYEQIKQLNANESLGDVVFVS